MKSQKVMFQKSQKLLASLCNFCNFIAFSPFRQKQSLNFSDVLHKENYSLSVSKYVLILMQWILVSVAVQEVIELRIF